MCQQQQVQPVGNKPGDMKDLVKALRHIKTLDGTDAQVDIINMSMGQHSLAPGLDEAINDLASKKVIISSAGQWEILFLTVFFLLDFSIISYFPQC